MPNYRLIGLKIANYMENYYLRRREFEANVDFLH